MRNKILLKFKNKVQNKFLLIMPCAFLTFLNSSAYASEQPENISFVQSSVKWVKEHPQLIIATGIAATAVAFYYLHPSEPMNSAISLDQEPTDCRFYIHNPEYFNFYQYAYENITSSAQGFISKFSGWLSHCNIPFDLHDRLPFNNCNKFSFVKC